MAFINIVVPSKITFTVELSKKLDGQVDRFLTVLEQGEVDTSGLIAATAAVKAEREALAGEVAANQPQP